MAGLPPLAPGATFTRSQSATLQVIAVAPYSYRSLVASATYTLPSSPASSQNASASSSALDQPHDDVVPVRFVFAQVDKTGAGGAPGKLHFRIDPMQTGNGLLKRHGAASLEGQAEPPNAAVMVPVFGLFAVLHHGKDAIIKPGTPFTACLDSSSLLASNAT
jgi:hypothetical protein